MHGRAVLCRFYIYIFLTVYSDFDITLGPLPKDPWLFTALHAPGDVPYLVTMVMLS